MRGYAGNNSGDSLRISKKLLLWGILLNSVAVPLPILLASRDLNIDGITGELIAFVFWAFVMGPILLGLVLCGALRRFDAPSPARKAMLFCACVCSFLPMSLSLLQLFLPSPDRNSPLAIYVIYLSYGSVLLLLGVLVIWFFTARRAGS